MHRSDKTEACVRVGGGIRRRRFTPSWATQTCVRKEHELSEEIKLGVYGSVKSLFGWWISRR